MRKSLLPAISAIAFVLPACTSEPTSSFSERSNRNERGKVEYDSNQLLMKSADDISELVRKKIKKAQDIQAKQEETDNTEFMPEPEAVEELKSALRIVLARIDQDGTRANAFARLRRELVDLHSVDTTFESIADEAIARLKDESTSPRRTQTYVIMLENLMAELKPEIKTNASFRKIIETVRDADIKISDEKKNKIKMSSMPTPVSPSETASRILAK